MFDLFLVMIGMILVVSCTSPKAVNKFKGVQFGEPMWFKAGAQIWWKVDQTLAAPTPSTPIPLWTPSSASCPIVAEPHCCGENEGVRDPPICCEGCVCS